MHGVPATGSAGGRQRDDVTLLCVLRMHQARHCVYRTPCKHLMAADRCSGAERSYSCSFVVCELDFDGAHSHACVI